MTMAAARPRAVLRVSQMEDPYSARFLSSIGETSRRVPAGPEGCRRPPPSRYGVTGEDLGFDAGGYGREFGRVLS